MGIGNFVTYVEKALKWTSPHYRCDLRPEEMANGVRTYLSDTPIVGVRDDYVHHTRYLDDVLRAICDESNTDATRIAPTLRSDTATTAYGVCVDLSSFLFSVIADVVNFGQREHRWSPATDRGTVEVSKKRPRERKDAFDETLLRDAMFRPRSTASSRSGNGASSSTGCTVEDGRRRPTVVALDDSQLEECVQKCFAKVYGVIGNGTITNAHYLTLHYDENTTMCKAYLQHKRRTASQKIVSRDSVYRVYRDVIRLIKARMTFDLKPSLCARLQTILDEPADSGRSDDAEKRIFELVANVDVSFLDRLVSEKMQIQCDGDESNNANDACRRQRYLFGEGEWKCFYGITDVERDDSSRGLNRRIQWYVFGNDSDIGLGALLYSSDLARIHYVNKRNTILSAPDIVCKREDLNAYKAIHFLALCLIGNDYVPRLIADSTKNMSRLGDEIELMLSSDREHCKASLKLLSDVFDPDLPAPSDRKDGDRRACDFDETYGFARAFGYVIARLLIAVYGTVGDRGADIVETVFSIEHTPLDTDAADPSSRCYDSLPRADDNRRRPITEYLEVFVLRTLWYMAYCTFYRHMDDDRRRDFRTDLSAHRYFPLYVPRLPGKRCFTYSEERLMAGKTFEVGDVIYMRAYVKTVSTHRLVRVLETQVTNVLTK